MNPQYSINNVQNICDKLNQYRHQETNLFNNDNQPYFWKLSDLSILYPDIFNIKNLITEYQTNTMNLEITENIPEFKNITVKPIHILNVKEPYVLRNKNTGIPRVIKNGTNQRLTRIACEYKFRQNQNTEIEQAYFLLPNGTIDEITITAQNIKISNIRQQISLCIKTLSSYITHAPCSNRQTFPQLWLLIWQNLFNITNPKLLFEKYNIHSSIIDYMSLPALIVINQMLQGIIQTIQSKQKYDLDTIFHIAQNSAKSARTKFILNGTTPTDNLSSENSRNKINRINRMRINFWKKYYPESLR